MGAKQVCAFENCTKCPGNTMVNGDNSGSRPSQMRAVIFKGVGRVALEQRPTPKIQKPTDCILKVTASALCGSDLHFYRGHSKPPPGFIIGHEFVGVVDEVGAEVKNFKPGDEVVVPFTAACGKCFYCKKKQSSRCVDGNQFGNRQSKFSIDGGQADYVRVPHAEGTLVPAPKSISSDILVLMSDIFPTGYFAARRYLKDLSPEDRKDTVCAVVGCGPVGICAITSALTMVNTVYAIDSVTDRLAEAERIGAKPLNLHENPKQAILDATGGRGADVVLEIVGHPDALYLAIDIARPFGQISSVGVHTQPIELLGPTLYGKNLNFGFGRCPVRSIYEEALEVLGREQEKVKFLCGRRMKLEEAPKAFELFNDRKVHKVVFDMS